MPSGDRVIVNPHIFSQIMDTISVSEWQIVQQHDGLRILLRGELQAQQEEALLHTLWQALIAQGASVPAIWIEHVAAIPRNASGKVIPIVPAP
jgi:phenylacetate-CoA ligase